MGRKLLECIGLIIKWGLIQGLFYLLFSISEGICFGISHNAYNIDMALLIAIPCYTILFAFWYVFFNKKSQCWTFIIPWLILMLLFYLEIAWDRDWNFRIITIDAFMLYGWLSPIFGIITQGICLGIKHLLNNNKSL